MPYHVRVVNMTPKSRSSETNQDSEPSITVDPTNPEVIVGTSVHSKSVVRPQRSLLYLH